MHSNSKYFQRWASLLKFWREVEYTCNLLNQITMWEVDNQEFMFHSYFPKIGIQIPRNFNSEVGIYASILTCDKEKKTKLSTYTFDPNYLNYDLWNFTFRSYFNWVFILTRQKGQEERELSLQINFEIVHPRTHTTRQPELEPASELE